MTQEAEELGLSSITHKDTMEQVVVNASRATSIDVVQIAKRYQLVNDKNYVDSLKSLVISVPFQKLNFAKTASTI